MKKTTIFACALALCLGLMHSLAGQASAQMGRGGPGCALTEEQQTAVTKMHTEHFEATRTLRADLAVKEAQLNALLAADKLDEAQIKATSDEISKMRGQLYQSGVEMRTQMSKAGIKDAGFGRGGHKGGFGGHKNWHQCGDCPNAGMGMGMGAGKGNR